MIVEDFVMLARTEPTDSKKHGVSICSAGYSREMRGLIRIYPLPYPNRIGSWSRCRVPLRRPRQDSRIESWRIDAGESIDEVVSAISITGTVRKDDEFDYLASLAAPSIASLNQRRLSLGILRPQALHGTFKRRDEVDPEEQLTLFDRLVSDGPTSKSDLIPMLEFSDAGGFHKLSLREWGCAEYLRKNRPRAEDLWSALNLYREGYEHLLLVGNQANARNAWLVIKTISRQVRQPGFDFG